MWEVALSALTEARHIIPRPEYFISENRVNVVGRDYSLVIFRRAHGRRRFLDVEMMP